MNAESDKAEYIQSVKALLIPVALFLSTLILSAGTFLIYSGYALGWAFVATAGTVMAVSFVAFIRFQNKFRAQGDFRGNHIVQADHENLENTSNTRS